MSTLTIGDILAAALLAVVRDEPRRIQRPPSNVCPQKRAALTNMKKNLHLPPSHSFVKDGYPGAPRRRRNLSKHPLYHNYNYGLS